ncbi:MAG TPA: hypothetical protein VKZ91_05995, partial [Woeseiaceae bacterium]|nr:hypothetical protein [Woeseiaceae bacterium]
MNRSIGTVFAVLTRPQTSAGAEGLTMLPNDSQSRNPERDQVKRAPCREIDQPSRRRWYRRWLGAIAGLGRDMRIGMRSLQRTKALSFTVVVTLALGIGANAAIFSVVRGVLLDPLANRDAERLVYIGQSAPGIGTENMTFSIPEIEDFKARARTIAKFGDFSTVEFAMTG